MKILILLFVLSFYLGNSQIVTTTNNSYENSEFQALLSFKTEKDSLSNIVTIRNKSENSILIFNKNPNSSNVVKEMISFDLSLDYDKYGHFPNNYLFKFHVLKKNDSIVFSKKTIKKQNDLIESNFIFSYIILNNNEVKKSIKKINNHETKITKRCLNKLIENNYVGELFIKFLLVSTIANGTD